MSDVSIRDLLERIHHFQTLLGEWNGCLRRGPMLLKTQQANIQKHEAALNQLKEQLKLLQVEANRKEQEVAANDQAIARRKEQLQASKTNKEYQALLLQIKADEAARSVLDDEAIEAIENVEQFAKKLPAAEADLKKSQEVFQTSQKKFLAEKPEFEAEIKRITEELSKIEVLLPREFREVYDRLVQSVGGTAALAVVVNQHFCGECNYRIPINSLARLLQKMPIVCSSCARLLYVPSDFVFDSGQ
ncbi:MAG: zinc ribbon domain-containing protein [Thermoguttaceae bacterium]